MGERRPLDALPPWISLTALLTLALVLSRGTVSEGSIVLSYLLLVIGARARVGERAGWTIASLSCLSLLLVMEVLRGSLSALPPIVAFALACAIAIRVVPGLALAPPVAREGESQQVKDALLASVSHDLRTPLTTIKALAHDMAADGDERAVVVEEEADRLEHFVRDLLDLSQLRAGAAPLTLEPIAAEDVLGAALQRVAGTAENPRIHATLDTAEPLIVGRFDFAQTLRALVNLIENALKYTPADRPVEVSARREGDWLVFEVADRGPGIPAGDAERIFEPFYRRREPPDRGGTGLGLPIARKSAKLQGGSLDYAPRAGGGSVFTLKLPALSPDELERMSL